MDLPLIFVPILTHGHGLVTKKKMAEISFLSMVAGLGLPIQGRAWSKVAEEVRASG